jgi:hypothetical protein
MRVGRDQLVVGVGQAHEHTGARARQGSRIDAGMFDGLPGRLQQQPVLRVDRGGLPVADPEEVGVEARHVVEEGAPLGHRTAGDSRLGVVVLVGIPAALRDRGDEILTVQQRLPHLVR